MTSPSASPAAPPANEPTNNQFFDNMPPSAREALLPLLSRTAMKTGRTIYEPGEKISQIFFPIDSVMSVLVELSDGESAEVGMVGCEGMTGIPVVLAQSSPHQRVMVQIPDSAYCMSADDFDIALQRDRMLLAFALRYVQATLMVASHLAGCNALHAVNERCARWLLMAHDRVVGDVLPLTQEFLSQMLGVRRGGVTIAASALQNAGFISYARGRITVLDRTGLESATCECYESIIRNWKQLMGYPLGRKNGSL